MPAASGGRDRSPMCRKAAFRSQASRGTTAPARERWAGEAHGMNGAAHWRAMMMATVASTPTRLAITSFCPAAWVPRCSPKGLECWRASRVRTPPSELPPPSTLALL